MWFRDVSFERFAGLLSFRGGWVFIHRGSFCLYAIFLNVSLFLEKFRRRRSIRRIFEIPVF